MEIRQDTHSQNKLHIMLRIILQVDIGAQYVSSRNPSLTIKTNSKKCYTVEGLGVIHPFLLPITSNKHKRFLHVVAKLL